MIYLIVVLSVVVLAYLCWNFASRHAYESAEYRVLSSVAPFEVREYAELTVATTEMHSKLNGDDGSFMRLFRYISGDNENSQTVSMTTPVFMQPTAEGEFEMAFVLPRVVAEEGAPAPSDESVKIRERTSGRFAVIRFDGELNAQSSAQAERQLRNWMDEHKLNGDGNAISAGYDPPWTPGPLRRNEVLIRLE